MFVGEKIGVAGREGKGCMFVGVKIGDGFSKKEGFVGSSGLL